MPYMMRLISLIYYWITGWKLKGRLPDDIRKCIILAAPHTSNYDFGYSRAAFYIMKRRIRYLAKQELLDSYGGFIFKYTGAIGVDRKNRKDMVKHMVDLFNRFDEMVIMLSPEGTRELNNKWKTGFYHAALEAKVPIVLTYLDYKHKIAKVGFSFHPTGDFEKDMEQVKEFYKGITPRKPKNFVLNIC